MTSKERAALRAQANSLEPLFQVGKGGVNDALIAQTLDAFRSLRTAQAQGSARDSTQAPARDRRGDCGKDAVRGRSGRRWQSDILQGESGTARAQG